MKNVKYNVLTIKSNGDKCISKDFNKCLLAAEKSDMCSIYYASIRQLSEDEKLFVELCDELTALDNTTDWSEVPMNFTSSCFMFEAANKLFMTDNRYEKLVAKIMKLQQFILGV